MRYETRNVEGSASRIEERNLNRDGFDVKQNDWAQTMKVFFTEGIGILHMKAEFPKIYV